MASIRRTPSPAYNDRPHTNGVTSQSHNNNNNKFSPNVKNPSQLPSPSPSLSPSLLAVISLQKHTRKGFRRSLYRFFAFFLLGFLFGISPFCHVYTTTTTTTTTDDDFNYLNEIKPPHVNAQLDKIAIETVSFRVEKRTSKISRFDYLPRKQLIIITPTYNRAMQAYFLNRLGQVLRLVQSPLLWIVVEMKAPSLETAETLRKTGVMYRHLVCAKNVTSVKDRGVHQRNVALDHIKLHRLDGIVFFADDDNVYSLELFENLREISRFGTWPVAMLAQSKNKAILEGPVCNGSQVIGWHTNEKSKKIRRFHVDMSGFAFNSTILWDPKRWHRPTSNPIRQLDTVKEGFQETTFIEQVVEDESQMEGIMPGCSRILNWHLHLDAHNLVYPKGWLLQKNLDVVIHIK